MSKKQGVGAVDPNSGGAVIAELEKLASALAELDVQMKGATDAMNNTVTRFANQGNKPAASAISATSAGINAYVNIVSTSFLIAVLISPLPMVPLFIPTFFFLSLVSQAKGRKNGMEDERTVRLKLVTALRRQDTAELTRLQRDAEVSVNCCLPCRLV